MAILVWIHIYLGQKYSRLRWPLQQFSSLCKAESPHCRNLSYRYVRAMTLNLFLLYFVRTEEYCQTSPNKNKPPKLWQVTSILVCYIFNLGYTATLLHPNISNKTEKAFMSFLLWCWQNGRARCVKNYDYQFGTSYSVGASPYICLMTAGHLKADSCLETVLHLSFCTWFISL